MNKLEAEKLHCIVTKILWVEKRGIPDIEPAILFLCIRVTIITVEEKSKLKCLLHFLKHTINDKRVMGEYNLSQIFTWVDDAYVLHSELNIHTGGGM